MPADVLIVEPDTSLRELLVSVLDTLGYKTECISSPQLEASLRETEQYQAVFWSSHLKLPRELYLLISERPDDERWVLTSSAGLDQPDELTPPFQRLLLQPFRSEDLEAVLLGKEPPPEDPVLHFMRVREREFALFRKRESQLREAQRHQQELERMKNTFLSLVSHELRTPLTIISGNLHVLKKLAGKWEHEIATECVGSAFEGTTRLSKLVDELLRFTVSVPQKRDRWDLGLTLRRLVGDLQNLADTRGLDLELVENEKMEVEGDPAGLPDALLQLIENALVFNSPGGRVEISARKKKGEDSVVVEIVDNGPGIARHELDRVFSPFYQVADVNTRSVEGLGIGLSLARRTIEGHGGTLTLQSRVGVGTRATVTLPIRTEVTLPLTTAHTISAPPEEADTKALKTYAQELYEYLEAERVSRRHAEEQKRVLEQTFVDTLLSLIRMVDPRIKGGTFQGERVLNYARAVARHLDPSLLGRPEFLYSLLLYDIGKIGVAESVLSKSGGLTDQERVSAQAHAEIGAELLTSVGVLRPAIDAVRSHHERWDGSGYPDGLAGKEIPLLARIIAVVDSFDAMTVDRPYREALPLKQAKQQIFDGAGTAFDPEIVEAFSRAWPEITDILEKGRDKERSSFIEEENEPVPEDALG